MMREFGTKRQATLPPVAYAATPEAPGRWRERGDESMLVGDGDGTAGSIVKVKT